MLADTQRRKRRITPPSVPYCIERAKDQPTIVEASEGLLTAILVILAVCLTIAQVLHFCGRC